MKRIAYVFKTKKGNEAFKINGVVYVILKRTKDEIGSGGNFAEKILVELESEQ